MDVAPTIATTGGPLQNSGFGASLAPKRLSAGGDPGGVERVVVKDQVGDGVGCRVQSCAPDRSRERPGVRCQAQSCAYHRCPGRAAIRDRIREDLDDRYRG